jgi:IclR family KDG regulon transcriptional repressor
MRKMKSVSKSKSAKPLLRVRPLPAEDDKGKSANAYSIAALRASLEVLDKFSERETWSLGELTARVGQAKSRIFRILTTFEESGYLTRDETSGNYRLGSHVVALGTASVKYEQLRWRAIPPLQMLADFTGETVHVGILFGTDVVTVQLVEGKHDVRMHAAVGKRSPAHSSSLGKVLLAYFPDPEIDAYVRTAELKAMTPHTIVERGKLKLNLQKIREQGYAFDNEEREIGLRCIAAPITDHTGLVTAAVSISAPSIRLSPERAMSFVPKLKECARMISRMLGSPSLNDSARL